MMNAAVALLFVVLLSATVSPNAVAAARGVTTDSTEMQTAPNAVDLKQGMAVDDVQRLLGKPRRTSLRNTTSASNSSPAVLQWTYSWGNSAPSNSAPSPTLNIDFAAASPDDWRVRGWEWSAY